MKPGPDVVLHHVAQCARLLVVAGARADAFLLGDRDLHVVDVLLVEQRLEDAVREAHHEDVLDGLLAQVMIDAVDLRLLEHLGDRVVDHARALQIAADRLLDDDARDPALGRRHEPRARELLHGRREERRRNREVVDAVPVQAALVLDDVEPRAERRERLLAVHFGGDEEERRGERLPGVRFDRAPRELLDALLGERAVVVVAHRLAADADDRDAWRQDPVDVQVVERGQQLAAREIAAAAEDDDRHVVFLTACPPNWLRSAASSRSPNGLFWRDLKRVKSEAVSTGIGTLRSIPSTSVQRPSPESST